MATAVAAAGVLMALLSTFLDWIGPIGYWGYKSTDDVSLLLIVLASCGVMGLRLALPGSRSARGVLAVVLMPAIASLLFFDAFEIAVRLIDQADPPQGGVVVAFVALALLLVAELLLLVSDVLAVPMPRFSLDVMARVGLGLLAAAAVLGLATSVLPMSRGQTPWESQLGADVVLALVELGVLAIAVIGLALPRVPALATIAALLGSLLGFTLLFGGLNTVFEDDPGAWAFTSLVLCGPLGVVGSCLVGLRLYPGLRLPQK